MGWFLRRVQKSIHSPEHEALVALLRQLRLEAGLTQVELSERLGVSQTFVSKFENGERRLDLVQLRQLCHALERDVDDVVETWDRRLSGSAVRSRQIKGAEPQE